MDKCVKIHQFNWDYETLISDYQRAKLTCSSKLVNRSRFHTLHILFSSKDSEFTLCDQVVSNPELKLEYDLYNDSTNTEWRDSFWRSYSAKNIRRPFRLTYTAKVIDEVEQHFAQQGKRLVDARYFFLANSSCITVHIDSVDQFYEINHVPIQTNPHCYIVIGGEMFQMADVGGVYKMRQDMLHAPVNFGQTDRLQLGFKLIDI
jgi:hypothetical protein